MKGFVPVTNRLNQLSSLLQSAHEPQAQTESGVKHPAATCERLDDKKLAESPLSEDESRALRQEKLDAIKAAISRGDYDSDDLLGKAMSRMLGHLGLDDGE